MVWRFFENLPFFEKSLIFREKKDGKFTECGQHREQSIFVFCNFSLFHIFKCKTLKQLQIKFMNFTKYIWSIID